MAVAFILEVFASVPPISLSLMHSTMDKASLSMWQELSTPAQIEQLNRLARDRNWALALILVGWLHLLAFSLCYYLTVVSNYHEREGYLTIWIAELLGMGLIFRLCGGRPSARTPAPPLLRFLVRVWIAYFLLAFNLGSMNTLRGHRMFELFPAMASLASFAFLVMTFAINRRFFAAVVVMFLGGLLMAAFLPHSYLIFALAWWSILNGIGLSLWRHPVSASTHPTDPPAEQRPPKRSCKSLEYTQQAP